MWHITQWNIIWLLGKTKFASVCMPLIPVLEMQRQVEQCEFKVSLIRQSKKKIMNVKGKQIEL